MIIPPSSAPRYDSILNAAAVGGGDESLFRNLLDAVEQFIGPEEVKKALTFAGANTGTILQAAAESGVVDSLKGALETLRKLLPPTSRSEKIREMMMWSTSGHRTTLLHLAAISGRPTL
ncbi:unnamed protein product, partial [Scytosiphon promiscuus]